jgi:hypothetical protein
VTLICCVTAGNDETLPKDGWNLKYEDIVGINRSRNGIIRRESILGSGSFGIVFKATYKGYPVAVKEPHHPSTFEADSTKKSGFDREADVLDRLNHPNVVAFVGAVRYSSSPGEDREPCYWIVTERLGQTLGSYLKSDEAKDALKKYELSVGMAEGLAYLHLNKLIHRDVKPCNIMISETEFTSKGGPIPKFIDFGLSKFKEDLASSQSVTQGAGTMDWMAPEKFQGQKSTFASDVFSFGLVLAYVHTNVEPKIQVEGVNGQKIRDLRKLRDILEKVSNGDDAYICAQISLQCIGDLPSTRPSASVIAVSLVAKKDLTKDSNLQSVKEEDSAELPDASARAPDIAADAAIDHAQNLSDSFAEMTPDEVLEALSIPAAAADVAQKVGFATILTTIDAATECVLAFGEAVPIVGKVFKLLAGLKEHFNQFLENEEECRRMSVWCVSMMSVLGKLVRDKQFTMDDDCNQLLESASQSLIKMSDLVNTRVKSSSRGWTGWMYNFLTTGQYAKEQSLAENHLNRAFQALSFSVHVETREQVQQVLRQLQILLKMDQTLDEIQKQLTNGFSISSIILEKVEELSTAHKGNVRMINPKADEFWRKHFMYKEKVHWNLFETVLQKTFSFDDDSLHRVRKHVNLEPDCYISMDEFNVWTQDSEDGVKGACDKSIGCASCSNCRGGSLSPSPRAASSTLTASIGSPPFSRVSLPLNDLKADPDGGGTATGGGADGGLQVVMGARVRIHSLQREPELNGVEGEVLDSHGLTGRWCVKTEPNGRMVDVEASHLTVMAVGGGGGGGGKWCVA